MKFLDDILASTRVVVQASRLNRPMKDLKNMIRDRQGPRSLKHALSKSKGLQLIAELKQASPSQGLIRIPFDPVEIARLYEAGGAAAISVLTEERFFRGSLNTLGKVRQVVELPLLRKDFIIDEYQVYEARAFEADAILLIAAILDDSRLKDYRALAADLGMDSLVEVHTGKEVEQALRCGADLVGINNRHLETFETDLETTFRLIDEIPDDRIVISESGITSRTDLQRLEKAGADAVLIGEAFMKSPDIAAKIRELMG